MTSAIRGALLLTVLCLHAQTNEPEGRRLLAVVSVGTYEHGETLNGEGWTAVPRALASGKSVGTDIPRLFDYQVFRAALTGDAARYQAVREYVSALAADLKPSDSLIFYFSGHGISVGGTNGPRSAYLAPVDAARGPFSDQSDMEAARLISTAWLLDTLNKSQAKHILVILDACKSGLAVPSGFGFDDAQQGKSRVLVTSAAPDQTATVDGDFPDATLFTGILLDIFKRSTCDALKNGTCTATAVALELRRQVPFKAPPKSPQVPQFGSFGGDPRAEFTLVRADARGWADAARSTEPDVVAAFIAKNPDSPYREIAELRHKELLRQTLKDTGVVKTDDATAIEGTQPGDTLERPSNGAKYVWIPSSAKTKEPFWISKYEVSVGEYQRFRGGKDAMPKAPGFNRGWANERLPVVNVAQHEAQAFCASIGGALPTWEQWSAAALAGRSDRFPWNSDQEKRELANLAGAASDREPVKAAIAKLTGPMDETLTAEALRRSLGIGGGTARRLIDRLNVGRTQPPPSYSKGEVISALKSLEAADRWLFAAEVDEFSDATNDFRLQNVLGNVSEWTATMAESGSIRRAVVAGWSFADRWDRADLTKHTEAEIAGSNTVGFRCVVIPSTSRVVAENSRSREEKKQ